MTAEPSFKTRCMALIRGEVSARELEALQAAGQGAYEALLSAEEARKDLIAADADAWELPPATAAQFLAQWCAFTNQKLGEKFLETDYAADPSTVGFVPPVTAHQVQLHFTQVEMWLRRASRAAADPSYRIDVPVPYPLPAWAEVEPCPMPHLHAMFAACEEMIDHAGAAVSDLQALHGEEHPEDLGRIKAELAEATSAQNYAVSLHASLDAGDTSRGLHERLEASIKNAIERAYLVGQLAAMPTLVSDPRAGAPAQTSSRPGFAGPAQQGFDKWCLTDPATRENWKRDPAAVRAVDVLWANDPDAARTLGVQAEIDEAVRRGDAVRSALGHFYCCPWSPIYQAVNPIRIGGARVRRGEMFTFDVSAEEVAEGGVFKREVLVGNFHPTPKVDYCNPEQGGR